MRHHLLPNLTLLPWTVGMGVVLMHHIEVGLDGFYHLGGSSIFSPRVATLGSSGPKTVKPFVLASMLML